MKLLLAGDDRSLLDITSHALERGGFEVVVATDGAAALQSWRMDKPDLMLLGVSLGTTSGIDLCRRIREDDSPGSDTPIIIVTEGSSEEEIIGGFVAGADDYVTKSFSRRQLVARIQAVLRRRGILDEAGNDTRTEKIAWTEAPSGTATSQPFDFTGFVALVPHPGQPIAPIRPQPWIEVVVRTENQELHLRKRNLGCA